MAMTISALRGKKPSLSPRAQVGFCLRGFSRPGFELLERRRRVSRNSLLRIGRLALRRISSSVIACCGSKLLELLTPFHKYDHVYCVAFRFWQGTTREHPRSGALTDLPAGRQGSNEAKTEKRRNPPGGSSFWPGHRCSLLTDL